MKPTLTHFVQDVIGKRVHQFYICDVFKLENDELRAFLKNVAGRSIDYHLNPREKTLIHSRVRAYFREALPTRVA